jgi:predicted DNA-binding protein YlxM (UPF0122 family)
MVKGLYTNEELVDSLILDLNNLPKELINGQFIQFCTLIEQMGQKLALLRKGIPTDIESKNKIIEELKQQLRDMGQEIVEMTPDEFVQKLDKKDGAE